MTNEISICGYYSDFKGGYTAMLDSILKGFLKSNLKAKIVPIQNVQEEWAKGNDPLTSKVLLLPYWQGITKREMQIFMDELKKRKKKIIGFPITETFFSQPYCGIPLSSINAFDPLLLDADEIIAYSRSMEKEMLERLKVLKKSRSTKVIFIRHGVREGKAYDKLEIRKELNIQTPFVVGEMGLIKPNKSILEMIEFIKNMPDVTFLLLGYLDLVHSEMEIEYAKKIKKEGKKLGERFIWLARQLTEDEIDRYFSATDLIVLPYISQIETNSTLNLSIGLEGGKAVLSTPYPEREDIKKLYDAISLAELKDFPTAIRFLLDHPEERKRLESNARRYVNEFGWSKFAIKIVELFKNIEKKEEMALKESPNKRK